jgi:phage shock protein PspC (stress-responsive transcriptional regulator)
MTRKRLTKSRFSKIFGVAGGIAEYLNVDPTIVRMLFVLLALVGGGGVVFYLILAIIMPSPEVLFYDNKQAQDTPYVEVDSNGNAVRNEPQSNAGQNGDNIGNNSNATSTDSAVVGKIIAAAIGVALICIGGMLLTHQFLPCITIKISIAILFIAAGISLTAISFKNRS